MTTRRGFFGWVAGGIAAWVLKAEAAPVKRFGPTAYSSSPTEFVAPVTWLFLGEEYAVYGPHEETRLNKQAMIHWKAYGSQWLAFYTAHNWDRKIGPTIVRVADMEFGFNPALWEKRV